MSSQQRLFTSTHGRINRKTCWFGIIVLFVPGLFAAFISAIQDDTFGLIMLAMVGCIIAGLGVPLAIKRVHDLNLISWWALVFFNTSFLGIIILGIAPGTKGENHFGPQPR